jgi:hypothetical protein
MSKIKLIVLVLLLIAAVVLMAKYSTDAEVMYDCRLAEISPDYPQAVKDECRIMMKE